MAKNFSPPEWKKIGTLGTPLEKSGKESPTKKTRLSPKNSQNRA